MDGLWICLGLQERRARASAIRLTLALFRETRPRIAVLRARREDLVFYLCRTLGLASHDLSPSLHSWQADSVSA